MNARRDWHFRLVTGEVTTLGCQVHRVRTYDERLRRTAEHITLSHPRELERVAFSTRARAARAAREH